MGASSADIRLTAEVSVKGTNAPDPYEGLDLLHYVSGQITYVTDAEFEALLGIRSRRMSSASTGT